MSRRLAVALVTVVALGAACSSGDDGSSGPLDAVAPTEVDIASGAGITFPASTTDFRLVRIGPNQIDVTFHLDADEVDEFASGSGLDLAPGVRTVTHASPLWDVAVDGEVEGGSSTRRGVRRSAEVVTEGDTATVRLSLTKNAGSSE